MPIPASGGEAQGRKSRASVGVGMAALSGNAFQPRLGIYVSQILSAFKKYHYSLNVPHASRISL